MSGSAPPGVDLERLLPWFRANVAPVDDLSAEIIGHGRSNLTYRIAAGEQDWVLRRPPLSHVQPTAHDMTREFRVISALVNSEVPVPRTVALCEDTAVNDAPFYIMEYVEGMVPADSDEFARSFDESQRQRIADELIDILVHLHSVTPADVGLSDFGMPEGYLERQVRRFTEQLGRVKTRDVPELEELARRLAAALPSPSGSGIVHGDYRLDNTILDAEGHVVAVLDWEMATLGDPLADVGLLMMYWADDESEVSLAAPGIASTAVTALAGFPTRKETATRYAERSGRDLGNLDFYTVLAHFKLAVILENMHARFKAGGTVGAGFEVIADHAKFLTSRGLDIADNSSLAALRG
jgi:aminoglycoside phosphotransferase (APT) family kinase protein